MTFKRASGILLHPTSLPGPFGIGDIGPQAYQWIDFLANAGSALWQVLPLGPTGYGDSPYQCFSAFAGNPYIISPQALLDNDLLHANDIVELTNLPDDKVDFGRVIPYKLSILDCAFVRFKKHPNTTTQQAFETFQSTHAHWLEDYALFMALKEKHEGHPWVTWPKPLRDRDAQALNQFRLDHAASVEKHAFWQYLFFNQWGKLRNYANTRGVKIIGDIPIFVAHDSADVWSHPQLFHLNAEGQPTVVAGVPPDYFSPTGQRWGNPLYRWDVHAQENYAWWIERLEAVFSLVDIARLDHFRGFAGYWEIPAEEETAVNGQWVTGPGIKFFAAVEKTLGSLPILAEDLGEITPDVIELRDHFNLPGMKILVFAFDGDTQNPFLPHNFSPNCIVYTGTHDNDTILGWYQNTSKQSRDFARRYLARDGHDIAWDLIRAAWSSNAIFALAPMQDLLGLDNQARMNYPSTPSGNWQWRMTQNALTEALNFRLKEANQLYGRYQSGSGR